MEPLAPVAETATSSRQFKVSTVFMAVVVTFAFFLTVLEHWKAFGWLNRFIAVVLLFNLLLAPALRPRLKIFKYLEKNENDRDSLITDGYLYLLLATCLLGQ
jgi:hypothetical protein